MRAFLAAVRYFGCVRYATPATVSRCGMVWFAEDTVPTHMVAMRLMRQVRRPYSFDACANDAPIARLLRTLLRRLRAAMRGVIPWTLMRPDRPCLCVVALLTCALPWNLLTVFWQARWRGCSLPIRCVEHSCATRHAVMCVLGAQAKEHVMPPSRWQLLASFFALLTAGVVKLSRHDQARFGMPRGICVHTARRRVEMPALPMMSWNVS